MTLTYIQRQNPKTNVILTLANVGFSKTNVGFSKTNVLNRMFVFTVDIRRKNLRWCERQFYVKLTKNLTLT